MINSFLTIHDLTMYEFNQILELSEKIKHKPAAFRNKLRNRIMAMIFQKSDPYSLMPLEVAMLQLGGQSVYTHLPDNGRESPETLEETARNADHWVDALAVKASDHSVIRKLTEVCLLPVFNASTDRHHPLQAMADFLTLRENKGGYSNLRLAYIGQGNNVCHSLILASAKAGVQLTVASPGGYAPDTDILIAAGESGKDTGFRCRLTSDPFQAVKDADVVYCSAWPSREKEEEQENIAQIFKPFQVNSRLMAKARSDALFMHYPPIHRGEEVTGEVIDAHASAAHDQAENRLHVQKSVLLLLLGDK